MKKYRCVKTDIKTQGFGENLTCVKTSVDGTPIKPFQVVTKAEMFCPFGYRSFYPAIGMKGHNGVDRMAYRDEPIYFPWDILGIRWFATTEVDPDGGVGLRVHSLDPIYFKEEDLPAEMSDHSKRIWKESGGYLHLTWLAWHLKDVNLADKPLIQVGVFADGRPQMRSEIKFGDLVAFADNTGASSGDHVHDADKFSIKNSMTIGNDNGYYGAVNLDKFYENVFVGDVVAVKKQAVSVVELVITIIKEIQAYLVMKLRK